MMKQIKLAFLAAAMLAVVTSAQAFNYNSDLIIGFSDGLHNDVVYDLGAKSAITNGETWNLNSFLGSFNLSAVNWGVIGDKLTIGTAWATTDGTFAPGTLGNLQFLSPIDNAIGTIYGNMPAAGAGQHFSISDIDDTSWNVETINADHDSDYVSEYINPNSIGLVTNNFYNIKDDGSAPVLLGHFNLASTGIVTYNTNTISSSPSLPVPSFSGTPTNIFVTQSVVFTNTSTGNLTNVWSFGDGNVATNSTGANVTNTYNTPNTYTVSLTVTGTGGSSNLTRTAYITVKPKISIGSPVLSNGKFIFSGTNGPAGAQYRILSSTNASLALTNWTPVATNVFAVNGSYNYTNSPITNMANFFRLVSP